ncbi:MAG: cation:proton antiporter [Micromonosporaceae bacterium]
MNHDQVLALIEIGGILLVLGLLGALSARINLSPIPLYLLAGLAFGEGGILPLATSEEFISTGAAIGVILLLFTLGLEYSAAELVTTMRRSAVGGVLDVVLNATPGVAAALLLGWGPAAAAALGGITYASSSGIIAKVTADLGWLGNREIPTVLSLVVFEDLVMVAYLPVLAALLVGAGLVDAGFTLAVAAVFVAVALLASLKFGRQIEGFLTAPHSREPSDEVLLLKLLGLTLLVAGLAESAHVSAAVGAFLVGIALSGPLAHTARNLITPLRDLFGAVFFVFFGLSTDPRQLPQVAGIALALAAAGIATKYATGWYAARRAGIGTAGRIRAGAALIPRGEFNIVIAGLAVAAGIQPQLGPLAAAYVLILAITGPLAARAAEPLARAAGRRYRPPGRQENPTSA